MQYGFSFLGPHFLYEHSKQARLAQLAKITLNSCNFHLTVLCSCIRTLTDKVMVNIVTVVTATAKISAGGMERLTGVM